MVPEHDIFKLLDHAVGRLREQLNAGREAAKARKAPSGINWRILELLAHDNFGVIPGKHKHALSQVLKLKNLKPLQKDKRSEVRRLLDQFKQDDDLSLLVSGLMKFCKDSGWIDEDNQAVIEAAEVTAPIRKEDFQLVAYLIID